MKFTRFLSALLIFCILIASSTYALGAERSGPEVDAPVKRFIAFYFHEYKRELPDKSQLPVLATFVTPELLDLFKTAMRGEDCYSKKNNDEGPSLVEGDLFSSLFEGTTSAIYRPLVQKADKATFAIEWTNDGVGTSSPPFVWKDQIFLVKTTSGWLISDFAHLGTWDFMMKGNVSQILRGVAKECAD